MKAACCIKEELCCRNCSRNLRLGPGDPQTVSEYFIGGSIQNVINVNFIVVDLKKLNFYLSNHLSSTLGLRFIHHHPRSSHCHIQFINARCLKTIMFPKLPQVLKMHKCSWQLHIVALLLCVSGKAVIKKMLIFLS